MKRYALTIFAERPNTLPALTMHMPTLLPRPKQPSVQLHPAPQGLALGPLGHRLPPFAAQWLDGLLQSQHVWPASPPTLR